MSQADPQASLARLKQTLSQLQAVVTTLEGQELNISATVLDNLVADTENLVQQLQQTTTTKSTATQETATSATAQTTSDEWDDDLFDAAPPVKTPTKPVSPATTPTIRKRKKQPWWEQQKIWIGAAAAAIAFIFIWKLTTGKPEMIADIAQSEPSETIEQVEPVTPQPELPQTPPIAEPKPEPQPEVVKPLTPEQRLIAAIQGQLEDVTQPYGDNIVRSIQADFNQSTLHITVGDAWYLLKEGLQDRLGTEVLKLAQMLDFKKMVVEDLAGNFVARNPVVGDRLVITRRYQDFPEKNEITPQ